MARTRLAPLLGLLAAIVMPTSRADLALDVEAGPSPVRPGETVDVIVTVSNVGNVTETGVIVSALVPGQIDTFREDIARPDSLASCTGGPVSSSLCEPGEELVWTIGVLDPGEGISVRMPPIVASGAFAPPDGTSILFSAAAAASGLSPVQTSASVEVLSAPVLALALSEGASPVAPGAVLEYTLTYANVSAATQSMNATLAMTLPPGASVLEASDGGTAGAGGVTWSLGSLSPGTSGVVRVRAEISAGVGDGSLLSTTAELTADGGDSASAKATTRVQAAAPLGFAIELDRQSAGAGESVHALLTVTNRSAVARNDVVLSARVPDEADDFREDIARPNELASCFGGPVSSSQCEQAERLVWTIGTLEPGAGITVAMPPIVSAGLADGRLMEVSGWAIDDSNAQARARRTSVIDNAPVLALSVTPAASPIGAGDRLDYVILYANRAAVAAFGAIIEIPVPLGTTFLSASDGGALVNGVVQWPLGTLEAGAAGAVRLTLAVDAAAADGDIVRLLGRLRDDLGTEIRAASETRVEQDAALGMSIELAADPVRPGDTQQALLTVTNRSAMARNDIVVTAFVPDEVDDFREDIARPNELASCFGGPVSSSQCEQAERLVWTIGTLEPGAGITVAMPPIVSAGLADGRLMEVSGWAIDDSNAQARARRVAAVAANPVLAVAIDPIANPVEAGARQAYVITYANVSAATAAQNVQLSVPIPAGATFAAASDGGAPTGAQVVWPLGDLAAGEAGTVTVALQIDPGVANGEVVRARAEIRDDGGNAARDLAETRVQQDAPLGIAVELGADPVRVDETFVATLTVTNRDSSARTGVVVTAFVPDHVNDFREDIADPNSLASCSGGPVSSSQCEQGERVVWSIGTLAPGDAASVLLPTIAAPGQPPGSLVNQIAWASDDANAQAVATASGVSLTSAALDLDLSASDNAIAPGQAVTFTLTVGQVESGAGSVQLTLPIPDGANFASATDGGVLVGGAVVWSLANLDKGEGAQVSATIATDPSLADGAFVIARAVARTSSPLSGEARALAVARVDATNDLELTGNVGTLPLLPGATREATFTVLNTGTTDATGVTVVVLRADEIDNLAENQTSADSLASCTGGPLSSSLCEQAERFVWNIGTLAPSASATVTVPAILSEAASTGPNGQVLRYHALATDADGHLAGATAADYIGDRDGVADPFDNCLFVPNPTQLDADNDGYGNACDPDLNNDNIVNAADLGLFRSVFFSADAVADFNGDGIVNVLDLGVLKNYFFAPPGPSGTTP